MSGWIIYLISILDALNAFFIVVCIVASLGLVARVIYFTTEDFWNDKEFNFFTTGIKRVCIFSFICLAATIFIPTKENMVLMYVVPKIVNNKEIQALPPRLLKSLNDTLDHYDAWINKKYGENDE
jgi:hypothetical protein